MLKGGRAKGDVDRSRRMDRPLQCVKTSTVPYACCLDRYEIRNWKYPNGELSNGTAYPINGTNDRRNCQSVEGLISISEATGPLHLAPSWFIPFCIARHTGE